MIPNIPPRKIIPVPPAQMLSISIPDEVILWLIENLSQDNIMKIFSTPVFKEKIKGYRSYALSAEKIHSLILEEFRRSSSFLFYLGSLWKEQEKDRLKVLFSIPENEMISDYGKLADEFGFHPVCWTCLSAKTIGMHRTAKKLIQEYFLRKNGGKLSLPDQLGSSTASSTFALGGNSVLENKIGQLQAENVRLKEEAEKIQAEKEKFRSQLDLEKNAVKKMENEILGLKTKLRNAENMLQTEKEKTERQTEKITEMENKIKSFSEADHRIRSLEKKNRLVEHDLKAARAFAEKTNENLQNMVKEKENSSAFQGEINKTLSLLFKLFYSPVFSAASSSSVADENNEVKSKSVSGKKRKWAGENLLILSESPRISNEYFKFLSSSGITLLYHAGFQRDMEFEKMLSKSWKVILFFSHWDESEKHADLVGYLLKKNVPFFILPHLSPENLILLLEFA